MRREVVVIAVVLIGGIAGAPAKADYHGDLIRRHEDIARYQGYYAKAEAKMYKQRARAYSEAARKFKRYGMAHTKAMQADAVLTGIEAQMIDKGTLNPSKSYISEWATRETAAVLRH